MDIVIVITIVAAAAYMIGRAHERHTEYDAWAEAWEEYYDQQVFDQAFKGIEHYKLDTPAQAEARKKIAERRGQLIKDNEGFEWFGPSKDDESWKQPPLRLVRNVDWPDEMLEAMAGEHIIRSED